MFSYQILLTELFGTMFLTSFTLITIRQITNRILRYALQMSILFIAVLVSNELHGKGFINPFIAIIILISTQPFHLLYVIPMEIIGFIIGYLLVIKVKQRKMQPHKIYNGLLWIPLFAVVWLMPIALIAKYHFASMQLNFIKAAFVASANLFLTKMIFYENEINLHNPIFGIIKMIKKNQYEIIANAMMTLMSIGIGFLMLLI